MRLFSSSRRQNQNANFSAMEAGTQQQSSNQQFSQQVEHLIPAEVRMISGCHSEQTSADVVGSTGGGFSMLPSAKGKAGGACTSALLDILLDYHRRRSTLSFQQLLLELRSTLSRRGFDQIPQLTSSRPLEAQHTPFSCVSQLEGNPQSPHHQNCRRALLVGINYHGQSGELSGCHNDVYRMRDYLCEVQGYLPQNVVLLVDDGKSHYPNRKNIITVLQQLVYQSKAGDSVFFHYSGHGGLLEPSLCDNVWKRSVQDYDEILYPLDHKQAGHIRDYSLFRHFVKPMPAGVTVTCVMDCCHSGSVLDLPYSYKPTSGGTIAMERNMSSLNNLALLYLLAGGHFPGGGLFHNVSDSIQGVTGESVESLQGAGMGEEDAQDGAMADFAGDAGDGVAESLENDYAATDGLGDNNVETGEGFSEPIAPTDDIIGDTAAMEGSGMESSLPTFDTNGNEIAGPGPIALAPLDDNAMGPGAMEGPGMGASLPTFDTNGNAIADPRDFASQEPPLYDTNGNQIAETGFVSGDGPVDGPPIFDTNGDTYGGDAEFDSNDVSGYNFGGDNYNGDFMQAAPAAESAPQFDYGGNGYGYAGGDDGGMGDFGGDDGDCNDCGNCIGELLQNLAGDDE